MGKGETVERLQKYLDKFDLGLKILIPKGDTSTVETAANTLGVEQGQIAKSLLFRAGCEYVMVVSAGDVRINDKKLKKITGHKPKLAKPVEVKEITGYSIGGVCPFDLKNPVTIYLDKSLRRSDVVYVAAGTANSALPINIDQLIEITGGKEVDVTE
ncbi:MAG: hypothetical protein PWQ82_427 [Thermosediminibacterales bacterium]|nr:hypothetical protein [Thermosediminibacterales bacterium]